MARAKTVSIVSGVVLRNVFGLSDGNLSDRKVTPKNKTDEPLSYDLAEVVEKCKDLIHKNTGTGDEDLDREIEELNRLKRVEEIRKLRIDNDKEEGILVPASEVEQTLVRSYKAIVDTITPWVGLVVMENPDCSASIIDSMNRQLATLRNKVAELEIES